MLFRVVIERHLPMVYASALRRTGNVDAAADVTRAVFLVLARRARRLRKKTVLAEWLFQLVRVASRKRLGASWWRRIFDRFSRRKQSVIPVDAPAWIRISAIVDAALDRLPVAQRQALLIQHVEGFDSSSAAQVLRIREKRLAKLTARGVEKLRRTLRRAGVEVDAASLVDGLRAEGGQQFPETTLMDEVQASMIAAQGRRPADLLARRVLAALAWTRWRRRVLVGIPALVTGLILLLTAIWIIESRDGHSRLISMFLVGSIKHEGRTVPGLGAPARPWPGEVRQDLLTAGDVRTAADLYRTTNIWLVHLQFSEEQWETLQPKRIRPLPHFMQPDGTVLLRNPEAQRSGLAGVLGFDFEWAHADLGFSGLRFTNVAARIKGNGTFLGSLYGDKRSWKIDLNKFAKGQRLGDVDELTLNNLVNDYSSMSDALAYEFFREAGVPASRTAYAYVSVTVGGKWSAKPLGLYALVEPVDAEFALDRFGSARVPIFKPVTYELFKHLGDDWSAYSEIYDLKTKASPKQLQRVIEFARLVTHADDGEFSRRLDEFLDVPKFARYLACEVILSNYDSFLSNGQNFYIYLDPDSNKFGFIPWDLDLSWGGFFLLGTTEEREQASIMRPWVGKNRFLERIFRVKAFRDLYRGQLEELLSRHFVPDRLHRRVDEMARVIRDPVRAESEFRYGKFVDATNPKRRIKPIDEDAGGARRPAHQLHRFIDARTKSVRDQLDGKSRGIVLERNRRR